jgi:lipopolysaccharide/colanic/teichoic acid biosynthesis glycosyltransferase
MEAFTAARPPASAVRHVAGVAAGSLLLLLTLPVLVLVALLVRLEGPGRVLEREPRRDDRGRPYELLTFRTTVEGARSDAHRRLREVVGEEDAPPTRVGVALRRLRLHRLPRLVNVAGGHVRLL